MSIQNLLMDLDETLYSSTSQLWPIIKSRINDYLISFVGIEPQKVDKERKRYYDLYGTTLRGLALEKDVQLENYLDFVHDVPVENIISKDQVLISILENVHINKHIFTNASRKHAERVLAALGIRQLISEIISIEDLHPWCKPQVEAFIIALKRIHVTENSSCLFIDDSPNNIETGNKLGLITIQINEGNIPTKARYSVQFFEQVLPILQQLILEGNLTNG